MYQRASLRDAYKGLFAGMGEPALFKLAKGAKLEWSDVFPLIYLKMRLEGIETERRSIKHLLVDETEHVCRMAREFASSGYTTLAVICKTQKQAERLHDAMVAGGLDAHLLTAQSTSFTRGVIICTAHMAKGLEFDQVIVPDASDRNYHTPMDRNLMYVACTRAMHRLMLTFSGTVTPFVQQESAAS